MKKILIIDDELPILKLFQRIIDSPQCQVDAAASGSEGVALFRQGCHDLVFLDLSMPGMNGVEALKEIRRISDTVPVYITTGYYDRYMDQLKSLAETGSMHFEVLHKPVDPILVRTIVEYLAIRDDAVSGERS